MILQLLLGTGLLVLSMIIAAFGFWIIEALLMRMGIWLSDARQGPRMMVFLSMASVWAVLQLTVGVWIWAVCFWRLGIFETLEPSVYFALVAFTTLGFGDVLLPDEWRLLGGMTAVNGLLNVGLVTAILVELLRQARVR